jgi:hypothetical protein
MEGDTVLREHLAHLGGELDQSVLDSQQGVAVEWGDLLQAFLLGCESASEAVEDQQDARFEGHYADHFIAILEQHLGGG